MSDLAVGEPCIGDWVWTGTDFQRRRKWICRCGAKNPSDCLTETALESYDFCECNEQPVEDEEASGTCSACGKML